MMGSEEGIAINNRHPNICNRALADAFFSRFVLNIRNRFVLQILDQYASSTVYLHLI
jgi:hypothetical protein